MAIDLNNIPTFLKAQSPSGLRRLMLRNNIRRGWIFEYNIMQDFTNGAWYAWYRADAQTAIEDVAESGVDGLDD